MKQLIKHKLKFDSAWEYVRENLDNVNALSSELLNLLDFKNGYFFTLLPDEANLTEIYHFKCGGILLQYPEEEHVVNGYKSTYSWIPDIDKELSPLILKEIKSKYELSCLIDDVSASPKDKYYTLYSDNFSFFYGDEVYYLLKKNNVSVELLLKCLRASTSFWHSLCVFTTADFNGVTETLSLEKIKEVCLKTQLVMVGAYDGEGYLFWEKNITNASMEFFAE
jgi:hypothetical protein